MSLVENKNGIDGKIVAKKKPRRFQDCPAQRNGSVNRNGGRMIVALRKRAFAVARFKKINEIEL